MAIRGIRSRIEELESEIEDLATRPRNVEGKDPQAEYIQRKTKELESLRTNYNNSLSELSTLIGKEFSIEELVSKTTNYCNMGIWNNYSIANSIITTEETYSSQCSVTS